jgi:hypothetical protein
MGLLAEQARIELALRLLARRARISIVHQETGVSRNRLRALYRELHGHPAPCGQLPAIGCAAILTRRQQLHASLFARLYARLVGDALSQRLHIRALLVAHDLYLELAGETPALDFNGAWAVARDLRVGASRLLFCDRCQVRYLVSDNSGAPASCPLCALYARREVGRRSAGHGANTPLPHQGTPASDPPRLIREAQVPAH